MTDTAKFSPVLSGNTPTTDRIAPVAPSTAPVTPAAPATSSTPATPASHATPPPPAITPAAAAAFAPAKVKEYNRLNLDFRQPMPRPKVRGLVIDAHTHLTAARHAPVWFEAADHFGIDAFITMTPLEEALILQRNYPGRLQFITIPGGGATVNYDDWHRRLEAFFNLGSRIIKFHMAPGTMSVRGWRLDSPQIRKIIADAASRGMILMSHIGDPDTWYRGKYTDIVKFGTREDHYQMWESLLNEYRDHPWLGAHMGGNPEDLPRLQEMLDRYPNLYLDCSATKWMVREVSIRRDNARDFFMRNQDRVLFGSDQVSTDDRGFDFLASRFWCHRKLWETAYQGPSPIFDPDLPADGQPVLRGLALPDNVLQKMYRDNTVKLLARVGAGFDESHAG